MLKKWYVECEPVSANTTVQSGAMVVYVACNESREEIARVAFIRRHASNPSTSYSKQIDKEMRKARKSVEVLNKKNATAGSLS